MLGMTIICNASIHCGLMQMGRGSYSWPVAHGPVCIPIRSLSVSLGRWRILKRDTWSSRSRAILQISTMCRPSLGFGSPLTTMYASPTVSTWKQNTLHLFNTQVEGATLTFASNHKTYLHHPLKVTGRPCRRRYQVWVGLGWIVAYCLDPK